jgi:hypothetical protein
VWLLVAYAGEVRFVVACGGRPKLLATLKSKVYVF